MEAFGSKIRVLVRVRPTTKLSDNQDEQYMTIESRRQMIKILAPISSSSNTKQNFAREFQFDGVYDGATTQEDFFTSSGIPEMIQSVLEGFNATVFAYGQTGSGKTYTMEGYEYKSFSTTKVPTKQGQAPKASFGAAKERLGIVPRVLKEIFAAFVKFPNSNKKFSVKCSFKQIYNEKIYDLLNPAHLRPEYSGFADHKSYGKGLRLRWSTDREFYVENLFVAECESCVEALHVFQSGVKHKIMASHELNAASSRSHCIFTINVESLNPNKPGDIMRSKLSLVDLAGSERVAKTGAEGTTLKESIGINKSLSVLRQVIKALADSGGSPSDSHIKYRDSKLTSILKHSLGGNSITMMVACLSPGDENLDENISTLKYASQAQNISNKPVRNEDPNTILIRGLREEIQQLKNKLEQTQEVLSRIQAPNEIGSESSLFSPATDTFPDLTTCKEGGQTSERNSLEQSPSFALKLSVIDNVALIKQLYSEESKLRSAIEKLKVQNNSNIIENSRLNNENQELRERIEMLEYIVMSSEPITRNSLDIAKNHTADTRKKSRFHEALASITRHDNEVSNEVLNQSLEEENREIKSLFTERPEISSKFKNRKVKRQQVLKSTNGSSSISSNDLKFLLSGKNERSMSTSKALPQLSRIPKLNPASNNEKESSINRFTNALKLDIDETGLRRDLRQ